MSVFHFLNLAKNAICKAWNEEKWQKWKQEAENKADNADLDLTKSKGIKNISSLFTWIPLERNAPPFLHIVTLGAIQKGIDMVKNICKKNGQEYEFHEKLYTKLKVLEVGYHGGQFEGNAVRKIMQNVNELLGLIKNECGCEELGEYFEILKEIQHLVSITRDLTKKEVSDLKILCEKYATLTKGENFKKKLGGNYESPALKGHWIEVEIPDFVEQYNVCGSFGESSLERTHHTVNITKVF